MTQPITRKNYMDYWRFTPEEKDQLINRLAKELPALRGAAKATQDELANAIGVSRQTYNAVEMLKRKMTWSTYMALILFLTITLIHMILLDSLTHFHTI